MIRIVKLAIRLSKVQLVIGKDKSITETALVKLTIQRIADLYAVDAVLAVRVARCESGLDPHQTGINKDWSLDRGLYQWNDKYHPEISDTCAYNLECATKKFCIAIRDNHLSWWDSSKHCWSQQTLGV